MSTTLLIWLVLGVVVLLVARLLVFQAGCAIANLNPNGVKSLVLPAIGWILMVGLGAVAIVVVTRLPALNTATGPTLQGIMLALGATVAVTTILFWPVYSLSLPTTVVRGAVISGVEQLLLGLIAALLAGLVMVVLAIYQVAVVRGG